MNIKEIIGEVGATVDSQCDSMTHLPDREQLEIAGIMRRVTNPDNISTEGMRCIGRFTQETLDYIDEKVAEVKSETEEAPLSTGASHAKVHLDKLHQLVKSGAITEEERIKVALFMIHTSELFGPVDDEPGLSHDARVVASEAVADLVNQGRWGK